MAARVADGNHAVRCGHDPYPGTGSRNRDMSLPRIDRQQEALLRVNLVVDLDRDRLVRRVVEADVPALARLELRALLRVAGAEREERLGLTTLGSPRSAR